MGGRHKDSVWRYYDEIKTVGITGSRAKCKQCAKSIQGIVTRMKKHYSSCNGANENNSLEESTLESSVNSDSSFNSSNPCKKARHSGEMTGYTIATTKSQAEKFNVLLTEVIAGCNLPLSFVHHPCFLKFCNSLRPGYKPPSRQELSEKMIPQIYEYHIQQVKTNLSRERVSFALDGWKNVKNEPLICAAVTTDSGESHIVACIDTSGEPQISEYLSRTGKY